MKARKKARKDRLVWWCSGCLSILPREPLRPHPLVYHLPVRLLVRVGKKR